MIIYFSTVVRSAPLHLGGELVKLDWDRKEIVGRTQIVPSEPMIHDLNPRGGTRGGRGILVKNGEVYAASYHTLHVFDRTLQPLRPIGNQLFAGLHELCWDGEAIWATATSTGGALRVSQVGETLKTWWAREDPVLVKRFDLSPHPFPKDRDNRSIDLAEADKDRSHVHLNAITMLDGRPLALLNRLGCLVKLYPTEIVVHDPSLRGCHNILVTSDRQLVINDTVNRAVAIYDAEGSFVQRIELKRYGLVRKILLRCGLRTARLWLGKHSPSHRLERLLVRNISGSRPVFVRGLAETDRGTLLVGISPATILEIDKQTQKLVDHYSYSNDVNVCVHGLTCA